MKQVQYDRFSKIYDQRYDVGPRGIIEFLQSLAAGFTFPNILEVGCGTGHWLGLLQYERRFGLDFSAGMLAKAGQKNSSLLLTRGTADQLPYVDGCFDLVYCVHAVQHFVSPETFIREAHRVLRPNGALVIMGMDPHMNRDNWYVYDYFAGTYETDLCRYPSTDHLLEIMRDEGFGRVKRYIKAALQHDFHGDEVFSDPALQKNGTSQLSLLTQNDFKTGMAKIKQAIRSNRDIVFPAHIAIPAVVAYRPSKISP